MAVAPPKPLSPDYQGEQEPPVTRVPSDPVIESLGDQSEDRFVDPLPDYLKCPICLCCLNNPYQVSTTGLVKVVMISIVLFL
jgi:hypothetical protein